jgi:hypothetical protein
MRKPRGAWGAAAVAPSGGQLPSQRARRVQRCPSVAGAVPQGERRHTGLLTLYAHPLSRVACP